MYLQSLGGDRRVHAYQLSLGGFHAYSPDVDHYQPGSYGPNANRIHDGLIPTWRKLGLTSARN